MKDHNSGAKEQAEEGGVGGTETNVVPFPRSWYGSVDELVPIDTGPSPEPDRPSSLADASAFWGGDAARSSRLHRDSSDRVGDDSDGGAPGSQWPDYGAEVPQARSARDRKSTRLNSSHTVISYAVFCLTKKKTQFYSFIASDFNKIQILFREFAK